MCQKRKTMFELTEEIYRYCNLTNNFISLLINSEEGNMGGSICEGQYTIPTLRDCLR